MKTLLILTLAIAVGFQSSGRKPGAATANAPQASCAQEMGCSWLPPGALGAAVPVVFVDDPSDDQFTFATITITVDPKGQPLGAYQVELTSPDASFRVLGVEAGDHPAFDHDRPPYFDPVTQQGDADRLILAEYARPQLDAEQLPDQPVVVATISVLFEGEDLGDGKPPIQLQLMTAGDADGNKINADARYTLTLPERPE